MPIAKASKLKLKASELTRNIIYPLLKSFWVDGIQGLVTNLCLEVVHLALQPVDLILQQPFLVLDLLHVVLKLILLVVLGISQTLDLLILFL